MPRARHFTSIVLIAGILLSVGAQCLLGMEMTAAEMPCCAGTEHDCHDAQAVQADCCQTEQAEQPQLLGRLQQLIAPLAVLTTATGAPLRAPEIIAWRFDVDTSPPRTSAQPKYVLLATFLI